MIAPPPKKRHIETHMRNLNAVANESEGRFTPLSDQFQAGYTSTLCFFLLLSPPPAPFHPFIGSLYSLFLNVWTPPGAKKGSKLPVMTWLYGGGFEQGASSHPEYNGRRMAEKGESAGRSVGSLSCTVGTGFKLLY